MNPAGVVCVCGGCNLVPVNNKPRLDVVSTNAGGSSSSLDKEDNVPESDSNATVSRLFRCDVCSIVFSHESTLNSHKQMHVNTSKKKPESKSDRTPREKSESKFQRLVIDKMSELEFSVKELKGSMYHAEQSVRKVEKELEKVVEAKVAEEAKPESAVVDEAEKTEKDARADERPWSHLVVKLPWSGKLQFTIADAKGEQHFLETCKTWVLRADADILEKEMLFWPNKLIVQLIPRSILENLDFDSLRKSKVMWFDRQDLDGNLAYSTVPTNAFGLIANFTKSTEGKIEAIVLEYDRTSLTMIGYLLDRQDPILRKLSILMMAKWGKEAAAKTAAIDQQSETQETQSHAQAKSTNPPAGESVQNPSVAEQKEHTEEAIPPSIRLLATALAQEMKAINMPMVAGRPQHQYKDPNVQPLGLPVPSPAVLNTRSQYDARMASEKMQADSLRSRITGAVIPPQPEYFYSTPAFRQPNQIPFMPLPPDPLRLVQSSDFTVPPTVVQQQPNATLNRGTTSTSKSPAVPSTPSQHEARMASEKMQADSLRSQNTGAVIPPQPEYFYSTPAFRQPKFIPFVPLQPDPFRFAQSSNFTAPPTVMQQQPNATLNRQTTPAPNNGYASDSPQTPKQMNLSNQIDQHRADGKAYLNDQYAFYRAIYNKETMNNVAVLNRAVNAAQLNGMTADIGQRVPVAYPSTMKVPENSLKPCESSVPTTSPAAVDCSTQSQASQGNATENVQSKMRTLSKNDGLGDAIINDILNCFENTDGETASTPKEKITQDLIATNRNHPKLDYSSHSNESEESLTDAQALQNKQIIAARLKQRSDAMEKKFTKDESNEPKKVVASNQSSDDETSDSSIELISNDNEFELLSMT